TKEEADRLVNALRGDALLEFRILANGEDDSAAIEDATTLINDETPIISKTLEEAQLKGQPPPSPAAQGLAGEPKVYDLVLANGTKSRVTYCWVKLGPPMQRGLGLGDGAQADPKWNETREVAARFRGKATTLPAAAGEGKGKLLRGALIYSREYKGRGLPAEEQAKKPVEYFVLARNPEIDMATGKET